MKMTSAAAIASSATCQTNVNSSMDCFLKAKGYDISKSSVGRYAARTNNATQRLLEAQEQAKALIEVIKKNPDADYTEGAIQIATGELTKRIASAQEEWDDLPLDQAVRAIDRLSRTKVYKDKVRAELAEKMKVALEQFKKEVYAELEGREPELMDKLIKVANRVAERLEDEE